MGQIKNIKLHIVTDIKCKSICHIMAMLNCSKNMLALARNASRVALKPQTMCRPTVVPATSALVPVRLLLELLDQELVLEQFSEVLLLDMQGTQVSNRSCFHTLSWDLLCLKQWDCFHL